MSKKTVLILAQRHYAELKSRHFDPVSRVNLIVQILKQENQDFSILDSSGRASDIKMRRRVFGRARNILIKKFEWSASRDAYNESIAELAALEQEAQQSIARLRPFTEVAAVLTRPVMIVEEKTPASLVNTREQSVAKLIKRRPAQGRKGREARAKANIIKKLLRNNSNEDNATPR